MNTEKEQNMKQNSKEIKDHTPKSKYAVFSYK